jgi:uncharacterized protein
VSHPLVVNVTELMRRAGNDKDVAVTMTLVDLGVDDPRFDPLAEARIELHLESMSDGLVVRGSVQAPWRSTCRRCLEAATGVTTSEVQELYQVHVTDPDAFELDGDVLDLAPMVKEVVLLDAPLAPLCRPDCKGICPTCGAALNQGECGCEVATSDPRWAGLDVLKGTLPDGDDLPGR